MRAGGVPYVAVDETRRAQFSGSRIKSFDFLVYRPSGPHWLVDVKGRKFPYDTLANRRSWENWVTRDDLDHLVEWERAFGDSFAGMLVFAYWLRGSRQRWPFSGLHRFRERFYAFLAVPIRTYRDHCVSRSPRWQTVTVPAGVFRRLARPL